MGENIGYNMGENMGERILERIWEGTWEGENMGENIGENIGENMGEREWMDRVQSKLVKLQSKLHKEFRWYCDTILQGGALAVRVSYKVHCAVETIEMVDRGEVRDDPALGEPMCYIGEHLYTEEEVECLLNRDYLLDEMYDTWCNKSHADTEWSDALSAIVDHISVQ